MFTIKQKVINNTDANISLSPVAKISRTDTPVTLGFFILHEGLISLLNDELLEKKYSALLDDCSSTNNKKNLFCDQKATGGWLGFTDKYWMSILIPDPKEPINVNYRHGNNGRDNFRTGYVGQIFNINPAQSISYLSLIHI